MKLREAQKLRKTMPEDSVVISIEKFESIIRENEKLKNYNDSEQFCNRLEQARKETAEKIFAKIDKELCECTIVFTNVGYGCDSQGYERNDLTTRLTKIAEQFGTSIEKYKEKAYRDDLLLKNYYGNTKEQTKKAQANNESLQNNSVLR